ncbi:MAG: biopolymer transporter ExbD [Xanthomonadaceae bacterium]|nr:biopolymer transporter ExbD [Xanthomonadaceae bacterium]
MAFSTGSGRGPMSDINVTPLVDVMLVLLIIFIVTAPMMTYPIEVALPQKVLNPPPVTKEPPPPIELRVDANNEIHWNGTMVALSVLQNMMENEIQKDPSNQPELRIDADPDSEYETIARILAAAKNADMRKLNFVQQSQ